MTLDYSCAIVVLGQLPLPSNTVGCYCVCPSAARRSEHVVHCDDDAGPVDVAVEKQQLYCDSTAVAFASCTFAPSHSLTWTVTVQLYWKSFVSFV